MNPTLASSYSRAMTAALSGHGYPRARPGLSETGAALVRNSSGKSVFDFTVDRLPNSSAVSVSLVQSVFRRIRNQDWSGVFLPLLGILMPAGLVIFFARDRYYRRRGERIQLIAISVKNHKGTK
jgi:hypothetical protein